MGKLTEQDWEAYQKLRKMRILCDVDAHRIPMEQGVILVFCSDGDQSDDTCATVAQHCLEHRPNPRIHMQAQPGGALLIPEDSPLNLRNRGLNLVEDICVGYQLKGISTVALYAHAPCGAATLANLSLEEVINLLVRAKLRLKTHAMGLGIELKAACFLHIDRGTQGGKRTYFVSAGAWQLLRPRRPSDAEALKPLIRLSDS
jgi:hypothetical protein